MHEVLQFGKQAKQQQEQIIRNWHLLLSSAPSIGTSLFIIKLWLSYYLEYKPSSFQILILANYMSPYFGVLKNKYKEENIEYFFFNSLSGVWSPTGSTRHGGHWLAYCSLPRVIWWLSTSICTVSQDSSTIQETQGNACYAQQKTTHLIWHRNSSNSKKIKKIWRTINGIS
jgi:hypothetical protein